MLPDSALREVISCGFFLRCDIQSSCSRSVEKAYQITQYNHLAVVDHNQTPALFVFICNRADIYLSAEHALARIGERKQHVRQKTRESECSEPGISDHS